MKLRHHHKLIHIKLTTACPNSGRHFLSADYLLVTVFSQLHIFLIHCSLKYMPDQHLNHNHYEIFSYINITITIHHYMRFALFPFHLGEYLFACPMWREFPDPSIITLNKQGCSYKSCTAFQRLNALANTVQGNEYIAELKAQIRVDIYSAVIANIRHYCVIRLGWQERYSG